MLFQEVLSLINIQGFGFLPLLPLYSGILLGRNSYFRHQSHYQLPGLPSRHAMNAQISWATRPAATLARRGGMLRWLGLLRSILGYLSRYECRHVLQAGVNLSWVVGKPKSPVLLRWRRACLTEGACIKASNWSQFSWVPNQKKGCFCRLLPRQSIMQPWREEFSLTPQGLCMYAPTTDLS